VVCKMIVSRDISASFDPMRVFSSYRLVHWIALVAIVWASVSPALGAARDKAAARTFTVDFCDVQGHRQVTIPIPDDSHPQSTHEHGAHCLFCRLADAAVALFSIERTPVRQTFSLATVYPSRFDIDRVRQWAWFIASPRAPPLSV